jgi:DNA-binding beta-propeller fold protein YncE
MSKRPWIILTLLLSAVLGIAACIGGEAAPTPAPAAAPTSAPVASSAMIYVLSNSSPHVSVIDAATNEVVQTNDIADFTAWTWNDDNNYFDGRNLWLGMKNPDTNEAEVIALDLDTMEITHRLGIGQEPKNVYIGKPARGGIIHVAKQGSAQVVTIDTQAGVIMDTWDVPVHGGVACDADITRASDGVERFYYPTRGGDTVVSLDPVTGETLKVVETPKGATPLMLTTAPDGRVWVQESGSNTNAVFDPITLDLVKRFPSAKGPVVASFSVDGKYAFIGHFGDPVVQVVDADTLEEVARITVGATPSKLAVHPNGKLLYAILSKEAAVVVIDTVTWEVVQRIELGTNPGSIYLRAS